MKKILIKNGMLLSPVDGFNYAIRDVLIDCGKIVRIEKNIECEEAYLIDAADKIVTPGWIDIHTHCYPNSMIGLEPDVLGIERGTSAILDAGSSGPLNYDDFRSNFINQSKTKVYTLLNISDEGLLKKHELDSLDKVHFDKIKQICEANKDNIIGLKARASQSVVGELGLLPIQMAADFAQKLQLPLTVHVGNYPPALKDVLNTLNQGDIVTHAFHGKEGGIVDSDNKIIEEAILARKRGVKFDIGHGSASFSFNTYRKAKQNGFNTDFISTDLHIENYNGPVYSLASVLTKLINLDMSLEECIQKVTSDVANHYKLNQIGRLNVGYDGDVNIISIKDCDKYLVDSMNYKLQIKKEILLETTIVSKEKDSEVFKHVCE